MVTIGEGPRSVVLDLCIQSCAVTSVVRGHLTKRLQGLGEDHRYDVLLVATELVTNVLEHTPGIGRLRVLRSNALCEITIEVDDTSELLPVYGRSRLGRTRGWGIVVVAKLAWEWGTRPLPVDGKTVFASVRCAEDETAAGWCEPVEWRWI